MRHTRRATIAVLVLTAAAGGIGVCGGTATAPDPSPLAEPIDRALSRATDFLIRQQDKDGAWRSDFYGPLKDGPSLTPLVLRSLGHAAVFRVERTAQRESARKKGLDYLA